ncbi:hypothetical protein ACSBR2_035394 [Camellia fascicularis]
MEKMDCYSYSYSCKEKDGFLEYEVGGDVSFGESFRRATFKIYFNKDTGETNCNCRLFEFRGILCRHHIMIFMQRGIYRISHKYILRRWSKIVKRSHTKIRISYDKSFVKPEARRYDKMCNAFHEVADLATDSEERCELESEEDENVGFGFVELGTQEIIYLNSQHIGGLNSYLGQPFQSSMLQSHHPRTSSSISILEDNSSKMKVDCKKTQQIDKLVFKLFGPF